MKCRRAKTLMFDFVDGVIDDKDRIALEAHLNECAACETMTTGLTKSLDLLHRVPPVEPDENFTWKVRLRIAKERKALKDGSLNERVWVRSWNRRVAASALAACGVVLLAGYVFLRSAVSPSPGDGQLVARGTTNFNEPARSKQQSTVEGPLAGPVMPVRAGSVDRSDEGPHTPRFFEEDAPVVPFDSLKAQFLKSQAHRYRMRALENQIDLLQAQLKECDGALKGCQGHLQK